MAISTANVATAESAVATMTTSIPIRVGPGAGVIGCQSSWSDLEVDHLGHDERSDAHPDHAEPARDHQPRIDEEVLHILAVDEPDQPEDDERQSADDIGRRLRFGRHR